jgi:tetratricopeptide (TPR) repeat protein
MRSPTQAHIDQLNEEAWSQRNGSSSVAKQLASEALEQARGNAYSKGIAYSSLTLAWAQFRAANYQEASSFAYEALDILETLQDTPGQQRALNILGIIQAESGNLTAALKAFLETHNLCQQMNDGVGEINALNNLAIVYGYLGEVFHSFTKRATAPVR